MLDPISFLSNLYIYLLDSLTCQPVPDPKNIEDFLAEKKPEFESLSEKDKLKVLQETETRCQEEIDHLNEIDRNNNEKETIEEFGQFVKNQSNKFCSSCLLDKKVKDPLQCQNEAYGLIEKSCRHQYPVLRDRINKKNCKK